MKDRGEAKDYSEEIIEEIFKNIYFYEAKYLLNHKTCDRSLFFEISKKRWDNYTENMNAKMKDFETKISSKLKKMSTNSADQEHCFRTKCLSLVSV